MSYLEKIYGSRTAEVIRDYKTYKYRSELVEDMDVVTHNSFVLPEEQEKPQN